MNTITATNEMPAQSKAVEAQKEKTLKQTVFDCAKAVLRDYREQVDGRVYEVVVSAMEQPLLVAVLEECKGNQTKAAEILSLSRGTLRKKLKILGMNKHARPEPYKPANKLEQLLAPMRESVLHNVRNYLANMQGQPITDLYRMVLVEIDEPILKTVMPEMRNNRTRAAKLMGISRGTLHKKLQLYGINFFDI